MYTPIPEEQQFFVAFRAQMRLASRLISQLPDPQTVYAVFIEALCAQHHNDGYIRMDARKFAQELCVDVHQVLDALHQLHGLGILIDHPKGWDVCEKMAVNPHVGWKGRPDLRDARLRTIAPIKPESSLVNGSPKVIYLAGCIR